MTEDKLRDALRSIHAKITPAEASAILDVARLAAGADGKTDPDELAAIKMLSKIIYELANVATQDVPDPSRQIDPGRVLDIGATLERMGARELAFASAVAVAIHGDLTAGESVFIGQLADALVLDPQRARELTSTIVPVVRT